MKMMLARKHPFVSCELSSLTNDSANVSTINTRRAWIIEQLASLVRNSKIPRNDAWITNVLRWFVIHGLFIIIKKASKSPFMTVIEPPVYRVFVFKHFLSCVASQDLYFPTSFVGVVEISCCPA